MDDYDERGITAWQIGNLLEKYDDPAKTIPIIATVLDIWCKDHGEDMEAVVAMLMETVATANGISYEEGE